MADFAGTYTGDPNPRTMFVEGPFGAGKTTFAIETLFAWLETGIDPTRILVMVPQRTMARPYLEALHDPARGPLGDVPIRTFSGLAKEMVTLYWPLFAADLGYSRPDFNPRFLSIETAQYAMADFVYAAVERGEFDAISMTPQEIAREIVDNLSKAATLSIDFRHVPELLKAAWGEERPRKRVLAYEAAGRVAEAYRAYCFENRLLDYGLQIEFMTYILSKDDFRAGFFSQYTHLIVEHLQEETALVHDLIYDWLPSLQGALLTYEWDSGYRIILGAAPEGAKFLRSHCDAVLTLPHSHVITPSLERLHREVAYAFRRPAAEPDSGTEPLAFSYCFHTYFPQMLDWVADRIDYLVHKQGLAPREIVVLAPYLSDALRFSLSQKLLARGIPSVSHRPSRALRDEPAARCLLALIALAHPGWGYTPPEDDVAHAFEMAISGLDPVRARLLAKVLYRPQGEKRLASFENTNPQMQSRITYLVGQRYDHLRAWLMSYATGQPEPLDHVLSRLFGEVLSQPGFGFHGDPEAGRVTAELIQSARRFRQALFDGTDVDVNEIGRRYFLIVNAGLLAGLYVSSWRDDLADAVFMSPAYTFLLRNRVATVQFWLDVGALGWWERLDQPLTHPYVLSRDWPPGMIWTDADEYERQQEMLYRIISGLIHRCRREIYLGISDLGEQGFEQRGPMLRVFQGILRRHPLEGSEVTYEQ